MAPKRASSVRSSGSGEQDSQASVVSECSVSDVASYSLDGLASTWDSNEIIRTRLREHQRLCRHYDPKDKKEMDQYVEKTTHNVRVNQVVLSPVLQRMEQNAGCIPSIDNLIEEVKAIYNRSKHPLGKGDVYYQEAWAIRRLCSYVKAFTYKPYLPKDMQTQKDRT